jgi:fatty acid synthase subunit alpha
VLFGKQNTNRLIEIGPSETLVSMAKKTLTSRYKEHDAATSTKRKLMCYKKDERQIRYDVDPEPETAAPSLSEEKSIRLAALPNAMPSVAATVIPSPAPAQSSQTVLAAKMADIPVTAKEIVLTIIAQKLKVTNGFSGVATDKSIKKLVGGMSHRFFINYRLHSKS